ncbi:MAG: hypothetical protein S4CHLAM2_08260 [Chlamydiales bacterium]|nr:hypothetical protein [Chlamydiales bacterium]
MNKTSKSKKRGLCLSDMPIRTPKKGVKTRKFDPAKKLRDPNFVAKAFFQALLDNDTDAALDAIEGYLMATGKGEIAKEGNIATSTIYHALAQGANPTLRTVARLLHAASSV